MRAERPDLAGRLRIHETGAEPPSLDDVRAIFFWLADPLEVRYPDCFAETLAIQKEAERRSLRMLNPPTALATYGKDLQSIRFAEVSVPTPPAMRIETVHDLYHCGDRFGFPLLIRGSQSFSHAGTRVVHRRRDIGTLKPAELVDRAIVTPLIDVRGTPAGARSGDLWARFYHRKRVLLIGEQCVPYSLFFAGQPVVSMDTSIYARYHSLRTRLSRHGWLGRRAHHVVRAGLGVRRAVELEQEFVGAPVEQVELFRRAGSALGLDFLAFDYASLPDGDVVIWEANPYPYMPFAGGQILSRSRPGAGVNLRVYEAFARCFELLLNGTRPAGGEGKDRVQPAR
jgi:hypothetical protein